MERIFSKGGGVLSILCSIVLAAALVPIVPSSTTTAYADTANWDGTATGTATISSLQTGDKVTLYQIATTKLNSDNTLTSAWINDGTGDPFGASGLTLEKYQTDYGKDGTSDTYKSDVNSIIKYVKSNDTGVTQQVSTTAGNNVAATSSASDGVYTVTGSGAATTGTANQITFSKLPAGLYAVVVSNENNKSIMYEDSIVAISPEANSTNGTWTLKDGSVVLKHSTVTLKSTVGTSSVDFDARDTTATALSAE